MAITNLEFNANISTQNELKFSDSTESKEHKISGVQYRNQKLFLDFDSVKLKALDLNNGQINNVSNLECQSAQINGNLTVEGNIFSVDQQNGQIIDKVITLNHNGTQSDSVGLNLEKNNNQTAGYIKTHNSDQSFVLKHPDNSFILTTPILDQNETILIPRNINNQLNANSIKILKSNLNLDDTNQLNKIWCYNDQGSLTFLESIPKIYGSLDENVNLLTTEENNNKFIKYNHSTEEFEMSPVLNQINDLSITEEKIADGAISEQKIQNKCVSLSKLKNSLPTQHQGSLLTMGNFQYANSETDEVLNTATRLEFLQADQKNNINGNNFNYELKTFNSTYLSSYYYQLGQSANNGLLECFENINNQTTNTLYSVQPGINNQGYKTVFCLKYKIVCQHTYQQDKSAYFSGEIYTKFSALGILENYKILSELKHREDENSCDLTFSDSVQNKLQIELENNLTNQGLYQCRIHIESINI